MAIKLMNPLLIGQIAAGEVVARPSSAIKELIENALDAGADHIKIDILAAGKERLSVQDNGCGITKEDLPKTIMPHATSKIETIEDLSVVESFGFRGEALASIASVAAVTIRSRAAECDDAWCLDIHPQHGEQKISPAAHPVGTTITVHQLFSNVPVRKRFLASERTEFRHILTVVQQFILQHHRVSFSLTHNKRSIIQVKQAYSSTEILRRYSDVLGHDFAEHAFAFEMERAGANVSGWLARPELSKSNQSLQFSFVNGRYVRDRLISKAVKNAYADILFQNRQPVYVIGLKIDPREVDVNIHPSKQEVRFRNSTLVYDIIYHSVKDALHEICQPAFIQADQLQKETAKTGAQVAQPFDSEGAQMATDEVLYSQAQVDVLGRLQPEKAQMTAGWSNAQTKPGSAAIAVQPAMLLQEPAVDCDLDANDPLSEPDFIQSALQPDWKISAGLSEQLNEYSLGYALGQLHQTFIVAQSKAGMVLIDMHAAHERVLYEKMKREYDKQALISQKLLLPIQIELSLEQYEVMMALHDAFTEIGFAMKCFDQRVVEIHAQPALIEKIDIKQFVIDLLAENQGKPLISVHRDLVHSILGNMACRAAIKTNRQLSLEEMNSLLRDIEKTPYSSYCNHGRPTWRLFSLGQLDHFFMRGQ